MYIKRNRISEKIKGSIFDRTKLLKIEELHLPELAIKEFENMHNKYILSDHKNIFTYNGNYPLYMFLNYVLENKDIVIHGSNNSMICNFKPRNSSLFNGKPIKAVFASTDGIWSLFFAVQQRKDYVGSIRNLCLSVTSHKGKKRYYYFSTNHMMPNRWTNGTIYFFPKRLFKQGGIGDEWVSENEVKPLAQLTVTPDDFPFLQKVSMHKESDSTTKTILKALFLKK